MSTVMSVSFLGECGDFVSRNINNNDLVSLPSSVFYELDSLHTL